MQSITKKKTIGSVATKPIVVKWDNSWLSDIFNLKEMKEAIQQGSPEQERWCQEASHVFFPCLWYNITDKSVFVNAIHQAFVLYGQTP